MTTACAATVRSNVVRTEIVPRHASSSTQTNATAEAIRAVTDAATSAEPCRSVRPRRSASHRNGPPGSTPRGKMGCTGEPGTDATSARPTTATTKPAIASVDVREERSTGPERTTAT